jgi:L-fuconolactonase
MHIVDTHCHASLSWYEPVESLLFQMDRYEVQHAVLIQVRGQTDNEYQFDCVERFPDRLVSVVVVDAASPDAPSELERLKARGARGVRFWTNTRSPGDDPLLIWRTAARLGLSVSCNGSPATFASDEFAALVQEIPDLPIVIEHLGGSGRAPDEGPPYTARRDVFALARFPNVYIRIHGLGEFAERASPVREPFPFVEPIPPLLELAYEAFGARRMMWGSNYPPVSRNEGYGNSLRLTLERFAETSENERSRIFGGTALELYQIG